jgi:Na+/glutamate symporter
MVTEMLKQFLDLELPAFVMNIVVDLVVKALSAQLKVAHLVFFDVLSPTRPLNKD